ncbi:MAG: alpha-L-fucosidase, partial [Anaerolineae bacterium]|nr:alpha-L-fucosidase [Anaerolineae bacterium]
MRRRKTVYEPTVASIRSHPLPAWFADAKLGIFVHWTPASVPGWAPTPGEMAEVISRRGWRYWFAHNPYAEWYANSLRIPGSPTQAYHRQTYGADFPYDAFIPLFKQAYARWDPSVWAAIFAAAGARYVVFVTKHHDGFLLWPSRHPNLHRPGYQADRDLVGELAAAVRARGLRLGLYYSGGLDWTFDDRPIQDLGDLIAAIPRDPSYAAYVDAHWRELIERYRPSVLWNDIGYPASVDLRRLFADYYNAVPEGVVNDRFGQFNLGQEGSTRYRAILWIIRVMVPLLTKLSGGMGGAPGGGTHADFRTPEYAAARKIMRKKWESCRGIGRSFGYNRQEADEHMIAPDALVRLFVDMVSKNGTLLLNVGLMADGTLPELQL